MGGKKNVIKRNEISDPQRDKRVFMYISRRLGEKEMVEKTILRAKLRTLFARRVCQYGRIASYI